MTIDLFLDLAPFTHATQSKSGTNVSVEWLGRESGLDLMRGEPRELHGFPGFDSGRIMAQKDTYYVGRGGPTIFQALVLAMPTELRGGGRPRRLCGPGQERPNHTR